MKVSLVVPTVNCVSMVMDDCLQSFEDQHGDGHEVILVDDGSDAAIQRKLREACAARGYRFLAHEANRGFAASVNRGIQAATGEIVVLVNNDVQFTQDVLTSFSEAFRLDERIGAVGGLLLYPNGAVQHGGMCYTGRYFGHRGHWQRVEDAAYVRQPGYILGCTAALLAIRRRMIAEIGGFDEGFFLSCEDIEFCLRIWQRGWKVYYTPGVQAIHLEGFTRGNRFLQKLRRAPRWLWLELKSARRFERMFRPADVKKVEALVHRANSSLTIAPRKLA